MLPSIVPADNDLAEDPLPELIIALREYTDLWRSRARHEAFNASLPVPLDSTEGWIIWRLDAQTATRAVDIARATGIGKAGISKALQRLHTRHLILLEPDSTDSRVTWVRLTERGRTVAAAMREAATDMIRASVQGWTPEEQRTLAVLLTRLTRAQADS